jgi:hypothetical protein
MRSHLCELCFRQLSLRQPPGKLHDLKARVTPQENCVNQVLGLRYETALLGHRKVVHVAVGHCITTPACRGAGA